MKKPAAKAKPAKKPKRAAPAKAGAKATPKKSKPAPKKKKKPATKAKSAKKSKPTAPTKAGAKAKPKKPKPALKEKKKPAQSKVKKAPPSLSSLLGDVVRLMLKHPAYKQLSLSEVEQRVAPAMRLKQFRVVRRRDGTPVGYLSWAKLDANPEPRVLADGGPLKSQEWQSGDRLWVIDRLGLYQDSIAPLAKLEKQLFGDGKPMRLSGPKESTPGPGA